MLAPHEASALRDALYKSRAEGVSLRLDLAEARGFQRRPGGRAMGRWSVLEAARAGPHRSGAFSAEPAASRSYADPPQSVSGAWTSREASRGYARSQDRGGGVPVPAEASELVACWVEWDFACGHAGVAGGDVFMSSARCPKCRVVPPYRISKTTILARLRTSGMRTPDPKRTLG